MAGENTKDQPTTLSTRETYIDHLDRLLQLHEQLGPKLSSLETTSGLTDGVISEARQSLESSLNKTKIASTAGSGASIVGLVLSFTPLLPLGVGLMVAGTATSAGASIANGFFFEKDAATSFEQAIDKYNTSSNDLQNLLQQIEDTKGQLVASLSLFLATLQTKTPSVPSHVGRTPANPNIPKPGGSSSFSFAAFQGVINVGAAARPWLQAGGSNASQLANLLAKNGGKAGEVLGKALGKTLGRVVPVLSIVIDVTSIITTWTGTNETLHKADSLRKEIQDITSAFRQAVQQYQSALEELVGSPTLQDTLRKLMYLRTITTIPGRPRGPPRGGPPTDPDQPCKMLNRMRNMSGVPLLIFASLQGQDHNDSRENDYVTDLVPEADVMQLSQQNMTAAVVDSLLDSYPNINPAPTTTLDDKEIDKDRPPQVSMVRASGWHLQCEFVEFGNEKVFNVKGSSNDHRKGNWLAFWKEQFEKAAEKACLGEGCFIQLASAIESVHEHSIRIVGGHLERVSQPVEHWYIVPICDAHNAPAGTFNRETNCSMTTCEDAWAVKIPRAAYIN